MGRYNPILAEILVKKGMHEDQKRQTVIHELLHDADNQTHCNLSESQVNALSTLVFAYLRDNPQLVEWLTG